VLLGCAKLSTSASTTAVAAALEVMSPGQLSSPGVLMPAAAAAGGAGFVLRLDNRQQVNDVGHLALPQASASSPQQMSSGLSPTIGQLVLCPTPTVSSQFTYQTVAAAGTPTSSPTQFCTVVGPVTSVLPVSALVQSVQLVPAAVGVSMPVSPVIVAGSVSGPSALFMVPN